MPRVAHCTIAAFRMTTPRLTCTANGLHTLVVPQVPHPHGVVLR